MTPWRSGDPVCALPVQIAYRDTMRDCGEKPEDHCPYGDGCLIFAAANAAPSRIDLRCPYRSHHTFTP